MHPLNKIRLQAGITIDAKLEMVSEATKKALKKARKAKKGSAYPGCEDCGNEKNKSIEDVSEMATMACPHCEGKGKHGDKPCTKCDGTGRVEAVKEMMGYEQEEQKAPSNDFRQGERVMYDNGIWVVYIRDGQADMVGVIPPSMKRASKEEKDKAVQMVKPEKLRRMSQEEEEAVGARRGMTEGRKEMMTAALNSNPKVKAGKKLQDMATRADEKRALKKAKKTAVKEEKAISRGDNKKVARDRLLTGKGAEEHVKTVNEVDLGIDLSTAAAIGAATGVGSRVVKDIIAKHRAKKKDKAEKEKKIKESMHHYNTGAYPISHADTVADPINSVGHGDDNWKTDPKGELPTQMDVRGDQSMDDYANEVKVPATVKSALKEAVDTLRKEAEKQGLGHTAQENRAFYENAAVAFDQLLDLLQEGSHQSMKKAQLHAMSLMGPMLHKLPESVWNFLTTGGQRRSLKDYMIKV